MSNALPATKDILPYIASVNPPRKAKRPRLDADPPTATTSAVASAPPPRPRPQLLPKDDMLLRKPEDSPEHSSEDEEDEYDPGEPAPAPKRRGRKPGPMSRSARESQRKLNHSRIEKARRIKINETLATLSTLVSDAERHRGLTGGGAPEELVPAEKEKEKSGGKGEKEFKLDVLVKTVSYIQELIQKVQTLEIRANASGCARCSHPSSGVSSAVASPPSPNSKRKRAQAELEELEHSSASRPSSLPPLGPPSTSSSSTFTSRRRPSASPALQPISASPCLPPISSWLPLPHLDPSSLPSPTLDMSSHPNASSHLPTPPLSGTFRMPMTHPSQPLPALSLPGPAHPTLASSSSFGGMRISMPTRRPSMSGASAMRKGSVSHASARGVSQSPTVSPSWTPEDETAASLLLQMSSSPSSSSSGGVTPTAARGEREHARERQEEERRRDGMSMLVQAETPSSMLGIGKSRT
ncbi:hypothetical protein BDW22DRAFT_186608 [Trametopsis cervina]|nr:hypothetical protein BDW22DRAFT_186608 [Trametopsis cervina]